MTPSDRITWLRRFVHRRNPSGTEVSAAIDHLNELELALGSGQEHVVEVRTTPFGPWLEMEDDDRGR